jgi:hypothetical protein
MQNFQWSLKPITANGVAVWHFEASDLASKKTPYKDRVLFRDTSPFEEGDPFGVKAFQKWQLAVTRSIDVAQRTPPPPAPEAKAVIIIPDVNVSEEPAPETAEEVPSPLATKE